MTANTKPTSSRCKHTAHHLGRTRKRRRLLLHANPPRTPMVFAGVAIPR